ncbi:MAG: HAD family phosphatase [Peptococcaceae bacterium]|nr:HAD family phosphatase [Peptococcaceae bacterium]
MMKGLIFDLDGTLLDSMPAWNQLLDNMLLKRGITPPPDLLDRTKTLGLENATSMVLQEFGLTDDPAEVYQMFQNEMEYLYCNTIPLKPGVQEFLDATKGHIPMAVATATSHPLVKKVLEHHHLTEYFHSITTVAEAGIGKHDPKVFLIAAEKLQLPVEECIVFEDSLTAIRSANNAGFYTVAIHEASNLHEQEALQNEANQYIEDFAEVILR